MSNLTDDIQEAIDGADVAMLAARNTEPRDAAALLMDAVRKIAWARQLVAKVRPGILSDGIVALIDQRDATVGAMMVRAMSGDEL